MATNLIVFLDSKCKLNFLTPSISSSSMPERSRSQFSDSGGGSASCLAKSLRSHFRK